MVDTSLNPFSGVITSELKSLWSNAISALLLDTALTVPCRLVYSSRNFVDCPNCLWSSVKGASANIYQAGGPIPFPKNTICPYCNGSGRTESPPEEENVYLMVIFDYKNFINFDLNTQSPEGLIQTLSDKSLTPKLLRVNNIIVSTDIEGFVRHTFQKYSEAQPCGFGNNDFVEIKWKRIG